MADVMFPQFDPQFVDALGVQTAYYVAGKENGRPIILLHGMTASADNYREIMHHFADDQWLIAPDIPGFGESATTEPYRMPRILISVGERPLISSRICCIWIIAVTYGILHEASPAT